ncbi:MAG: acetylxylan esterase [Chitinophagaceae bacterium]|nr:acetylxylan esterase [Chitinophagaceae bacterium]
MKKLYAVLSALLLVIVAHPSMAQPIDKVVKVIVAPEHTDWIYKKGEKVRFNVSVFKDGNLLKNANIKYSIGPEKMTPVKTATLTLPEGKTTIDGGSMNTAGFLRCAVSVTVDDITYEKMATAGFDPLTIQPTIQDPADFNAFWDKAKAELAQIPMDTRMTLIPEKCTEKVNVYHVSFQNYPKNSRVYGILCVPVKEGKYPAILLVPGAGIRPYNGDIATAEQGIITLEIGIHGIPVNMDPNIYSNLSAGALNGYMRFNMDNKDAYYYKRVYLGCVRANDFLTSLPQFDGTNLAVRGGSQGGALSIVTAALDKRVKALAASYPALCDLTGYLKGRAGGWPHLFRDPEPEAVLKQKVETVGYYDVVNFARRVQIPGFYTWGFNDETCPPTSMYAAYNVIAAPKTLSLYLETGHWVYPDQMNAAFSWLIGQIKK